MEKEEKRKKAVRIQDAEVASVPPTSVTSLDPSHHLFNEVESVVREHLEHADMTLSNIADSWTLVADEGEMKVYKREMEEDGMVVDPLKAVITVKGITGHELCHYFWEPQVRMEWESTLEQSNVTEWLSKDTLITHQVHKRIWPSTQRDSLFWSTIRHVQPAEDEDEGPDYWLVVNHSTQHEFAPLSNKCVRIKFNVAMICQTVVQPPEAGKAIQRENLTCKVQYSANVNPGGWAPASVIRAISKRELPKFLKTFTSYVQDKTASKPILF
jgi:collagen type IV alpha-3-binding protein